MNKARFGVFVAGEVGREKLESNRSFEARIMGFVDDTHSASADFLKDLVMGYSRADHGVDLHVAIWQVSLENSEPLGSGIRRC